MITIKNFVKVYFFLIVINGLTNLIFNKFGITDLLLYNLASTIFYLLYREFNAWGEKMLVTLIKIQNGQNTDNTDWQKIIKEEVEKGENK